MDFAWRLLTINSKLLLNVTSHLWLLKCVIFLTFWDIFLVSGKTTKEIARDRQQRDKPFGCLYDWDRMRVWAFEWSEIITRARDEMQLVRDHLRKKSDELSVSDYLRQNFPDVLSSLSSAARVS